MIEVKVILAEAKKKNLLRTSREVPKFRKVGAACDQSKGNDSNKRALLK